MLSVKSVETAVIVISLISRNKNSCKSLLGERSLGLDGGDHFRFVEGQVLRQVDGHLELGQDVLGHLERLAVRLARDDGRDVPIAQHRLVRQLQLRREHALLGEHAAPLFDPVALSVLRFQF